MKRKCVVGVFTLVFFVMVSPFSGSSQSFAENGENGSLERQKTLYERLGGYDAISAVVDEFLQRVWDDPTVGRFWLEWAPILGISYGKRIQTSYVRMPVDPVRKLTVHYSWRMKD